MTQDKLSPKYSGRFNMNSILMIGDSRVDIRSAYDAGVISVLDLRSWSHNYKYTRDNWASLEDFPDILFDKNSNFIQIFKDYRKHLPSLEMIYSTLNFDSYNSFEEHRFIVSNKFDAICNNGTNKPYSIYGCGRYIPNTKNLKEKHKTHKLTQSIIENKNSEVFPDEWIKSISSFIHANYLHELTSGHLTKLIITCIPNRPSRPNRLFFLLQQIQKSLIKYAPNIYSDRIYIANLFSFRSGVKSNHNDRLNAIQRFENINSHLEINPLYPLIPTEKILIIDDVCTSGASFISATKLLKNKGMHKITCLSIALTIRQD